MWGSSRSTHGLMLTVLLLGVGSGSFHKGPPRGGHVRKGGGAPAALPLLCLRGGEGDDDVGDYERVRREKLAKNMEMMRSLGISVGGGGGAIQKKTRERKKARVQTTPRPSGMMMRR